MSEPTNPYSAPQSDVTVAATDFCEVGLLKGGRIGRVRYWVYTLALYGIVLAPMLVLSLLGLEDLAGIVMVVVGIPVLIIAIMNGVRRCHDLDRSGWYMLLNFVPIVSMVFSLYLLFGRGTEGGNNFGAQPPENTQALKVAAIGVPVALGVIAAAIGPVLEGLMR